ncbi:hypothetical protein K469DRAFT_736266 [Zopfia rhizophila CBS 207.26]|uniref:Lytic polysaccharide monooxygenase n=1 Tax=Zopfia rhizophila CBS 207.26 TaxID=1314779 RepID=A0A6A6ENS9_9PEZI|nr:hypothetical protein K469DRAFT_736266 [Zopfia rhizophila CBS 207.26]
MRDFISTTFALIGAAAAVPMPQEDPVGPVRILPSFWTFDMVNFTGPGCPDFDSTKEVKTRPTFGMNTVDGTEIYYWHFAYPELRASIGPDVDREGSHTWCETTLKYTEVENYDTKKPKADYRLKLHKNGTRMLANYQLDEGVQAKWGFTYYPEDEDEVVDQIVVNGPVDTLKSGQSDYSPTTKNSKRWALPECGTGTIRFRTDLYVSSKTPKGKGTVASERTTYKGEQYWYGAQQGVSYDWEKCKS